MEEPIVKTRNITYDCIVFFSSKQQKRESRENFYGRLIKSSLGSLRDEEATLNRDTFNLNMLEFDTQKELLKENVSPTKALEVAIHMKMRSQNQQKTNQNFNTNDQSLNKVNNF